MSELKFRGQIKTIGQTEVVGTSGFEKREVVITTDEQYPQTVSFQFQQGNVTKLDSVAVGQVVDIFFNLKGKEWTNNEGKTVVFNTLQGWKIEPVNGAVPATPPSPSAPASSGMVYRHTDSIPEVEYRKNPSWTTEVLVANGKGVMVSANAPAPPSAPAGVQQQANFGQAAPDDDLPF